MRSHYKLKNTFQCEEKLEDMKSTGRGFHCDSCEKEVIDLRTLTSGQIAKIIKQNPGGFCGVMDERVQSETYTIHERSNPIHRPVLAASFSILATLTSLGTSADASITRTTPTIRIQPSDYDEDKRDVTTPPDSGVVRLVVEPNIPSSRLAPVLVKCGDKETLANPYGYTEFTVALGRPVEISVCNSDYYKDTAFTITPLELIEEHTLTLERIIHERETIEVIYSVGLVIPELEDEKPKGPPKRQLHPVKKGMKP